MKSNEELNPHHPSMLVIVLFTIGLFAFGLFSLFFFSLTTIQSISDISSYPPSINFDKGSFYGLGAGVGMLLLVYLFTYELMFKKKLTQKGAKTFNNMLVICLFTTLGLPHLVHYAFSHNLESKSYITCNEMSKRWLHDLTVVYVKSDAICEKLIADQAKN